MNIWEGAKSKANDWWDSQIGGKIAYILTSKGEKIYMNTITSFDKSYSSTVPKYKTAEGFSISDYIYNEPMIINTGFETGDSMNESILDKGKNYMIDMANEHLENDIVKQQGTAEIEALLIGLHETRKPFTIYFYDGVNKTYYPNLALTSFDINRNINSIAGYTVDLQVQELRVAKLDVDYYIKTFDEKKAGSNMSSDIVKDATSETVKNSSEKTILSKSLDAVGYKF